MSDSSSFFDEDSLDKAFNYMIVIYIIGSILGLAFWATVIYFCIRGCRAVAERPRAVSLTLSFNRRTNEHLLTSMFVCDAQRLFKSSNPHNSRRFTTSCTRRASTRTAVLSCTRSHRSPVSSTQWCMPTRRQQLREAPPLPRRKTSCRRLSVARKVILRHRNKQSSSGVEGMQLPQNEAIRMKIAIIYHSTFA